MNVAAGSGWVKVQLATRAGGHIAQRSERPLQLPSNLPGGSGDQDAQSSWLVDGQPLARNLGKRQVPLVFR